MRAHTMRRVATSSIAAAAVVLSTGVAAHAQSTTIHDKASDVLSYDSTTEKETILGYQKSISSGVDIRAMRVSHGKSTVTVTLKFAELRRDAIAIVAFRLDGAAEPERLLLNTKRRTGTISDENDKKACTVPLTTRTGPKGSIRAVIKRSCLDDPKRIKVAAISASIKISDDGENLLLRQDVLSIKNYQTPRWTKWLKSS